MEINIYAINIYARESEGISNVKLIYIFHSGWNTIPVECRNANKIFEFIEL